MATTTVNENPIRVTSIRAETLAAYETAKIVDAAWQAELDRLDIDRYTLAAHGEQGSELRRLRDAKVEADRRFHELNDLLKRYQDPRQAGIDKDRLRG